MKEVDTSKKTVFEGAEVWKWQAVDKMLARNPDVLHEKKGSEKLAAIIHKEHPETKVSVGTIRDRLEKMRRVKGIDLRGKKGGAPRPTAPKVDVAAEANGEGVVQVCALHGATLQCPISEQEADEVIKALIGVEHTAPFVRRLYHLVRSVHKAPGSDDS